MNHPPVTETSERLAAEASELTIDVRALQDRLASGVPTTIVDVRTAGDREEWFIPGSLHVDAYEALKAGEAGPLEAATLPDDELIVTVCAAGRTSLTAAKLLRARGKRVVSLEGGMKAWTLAFNTADVPLEGTAVEAVQVRRTGKGCLSYVMASDGEAAVIDASLPPDVYLHLAEEQGWRIAHVLDTHVHADHLSRSRALASIAGADLHLPDDDRIAFEYRPVREGDVVPFGRATLRTLHTPGHTNESMSYVIDEAAVVTGDTLFADGIGRPDLKANRKEAARRAGMLYDSLQRLVRTVPSDALVLPGHTSRPVDFDGRPIAATIADVRRSVDILELPRDAFVERILARIPPTPANFEHIVALNEAGATEVDDVLELEAGANRCAIG